MPQPFTPSGPPACFRASLRRFVPSSNITLIRAFLAASLLLLPAAPPPAEAAQGRQGRTTASVQKRQASPPAVRKAARRQSAARPARPSAQKERARAAPSRHAAQRARRTPVITPAEAAEREKRIIEAALRQAERKTGLSAEVLLRIAERESSLNPSAQNRLSSARGLMQFTRDTWLEVVRDFGPEHGLSAEAARLITDRQGNIGTRNWQELQAILNLRDNPRLSVLLAAERLKKAQPALERAINRPARPADLYLVHLLGPTGARQFLTAVQKAPARSSASVVGEVAKLNPGVFMRQGQSMTVGKVYEEVAEMFGPRTTPEEQPASPILLADSYP